MRSLGRCPGVVPRRRGSWRRPSLLVRRDGGRSLALLAVLGGASLAAVAAPLDAAALPPGKERAAATAEECAVWRREASFAGSVQKHDLALFTSHLQPGTVFNNGAVAPLRGRDAVAQAWQGIVGGEEIALRWRAGVVHIGGDPNVAISRGPYILQRGEGSAASLRVGLYQTVWTRSGADPIWRVLFDGSASEPVSVADRAAAERWVEERPTSDCAAS